MFEPNASWSLPQHLYMVSEWSAFCTNPLDPSTCRGDVQNPNPDSTLEASTFATPDDGQLHYAWTDITYLLHRQNVSWGYYVFQGSEPDCENDASMSCTPVQQGPTTPGIWVSCSSAACCVGVGSTVTSGRRARGSCGAARRAGRSRRRA